MTKMPELNNLDFALREAYQKGEERPAPPKARRRRRRYKNPVKVALLTEATRPERNPRTQRNRAMKVAFQKALGL